MGNGYGKMSQAAAGHELGKSRRAIQDYEAYEGRLALPLAIGLACAAIEAGLDPIKEEGDHE